MLFVDLVGFTNRSDRADPEDVRATLRPYHERVKADIERFGGTVEKFIGDAVMAVFGAPIAHEDDAERAVRAALRILDTIEELRGEGLDVAVRAAVTTGEAVVALGARPERGEGIVTGDVVNTAARLQAAAPVGAVIVDADDDALDRGGDRVRDARAGRGEGEGRADPGLARDDARSRFGVRHRARRTRRRSSGATHERALLVETFSRASASRPSQLVTVVGEPGDREEPPRLRSFRDELDERPDLVTLAPRALPALRRGHHVLGAGRDREGRGRNPRDRLAGAGAARSSARVAEAHRGRADRAWIADRLAPLVGVQEDGVRRRAATRRSPPGGGTSRRWPRGDQCVLVIEDLHWADAALLDFVEHLARLELRPVPLLLLCTARPELFERAAGLGRGPAQRDDDLALAAVRRGHGAARLVLLERYASCPPRRRPRSSSAQEATRCTPSSSRACSASAATSSGLALPETVQALMLRGSTRSRQSSRASCRMHAVLGQGLLERRARCNRRARSRRVAGEG